MTEMDTLAIKQQNIGNAIEKLWTNYGKDSNDRKTLEYLTSRLNNLEQQWAEFERTDDEMREKCPDPPTHQYFIKDFFQQVERVYLRLKTDIILRRDKLLVQGSDMKATTSSTPQENSNTAGRQLLTSFNNAMLTMKQLLASATQPTCESKLVCEHMVSRIIKYLGIMEEKEKELIRQSITYSQQEYQELQAMAESAVMELKTKLEGATTKIEMVVKPPMMKLSKISVPKFNGNHTEWHQFHDLFTQLVHRQDMTNAMKMFYLKDNLSGEAEKLIRHLTVSDMNYDAAWSILKDKYDNQREILNNWLEKLFELNVVAFESSEKIKQIHDTVRETTLAIESMNLPQQQVWETMVLYLVSKKLDNTSKTLYEQSLEEPQLIQPLNSFIKFLYTRYRSLKVQGGHNQHRAKPTKTSMVAVHGENCTHKLCRVGINYAIITYDIQP